MATLNTKTLIQLKALLWQSLGSDYITFATTTNIGAGLTVVSTTLNQYDNASNSSFVGWWVYIDGTANAGVARKVNTYATDTGTLTIYGANLSAESAAVTCYLSRFDPNHIERALLRACEEVYPSLYKAIDNQSLVTGNILPDGSFEDWSSSSALNWWTAGSATLARTNTAGLIWGQKGSYSVKVTAGAANDYIELTSDTYPRLLDLMGKTVNFYCMANPETADDPTIQIYTLKYDGSTAQTLTSTTSATAGEWTKLELENQSLNDDLEYVRIRFIVVTNGQYCYFDNAILNGMPLREYMLPSAFYGGHLSQVFIQNVGYSEEPAYDIQPFITMYNSTEVPFEIVNDGTYLYMVLPYAPTELRRLRLVGYSPLEVATADISTITIDAHRIPLLIAKAREIFWGREGVPVSQEDRKRFEYERAKAEMDYRRLLKFRMPVPSEMIKFR